MREFLRGFLYNFSMVLNIDITPKIEARLRRQAKAAGKDMRSFVSQIIERASAKPSLEELLHPLRKQFAESGISDHQLIEDITEAQTEYRTQKHDSKRNQKHSRHKQKKSA